jgi:hypothetical protein
MALRHVATGMTTRAAIAVAAGVTAAVTVVALGRKRGRKV